MRRDLESLIREVREELRAPGPDGGGYGDFLLTTAINRAQSDLAEVFTIRDKLNFTTEEDKSTYDIKDLFEDIEIENILRVIYEGNQLTFIDLDRLEGIYDLDSGVVRYWNLWGSKLTLVGDLEPDKTVELYVTRAPKALKEPGDTPELPYYADEAIVCYAISVMYRESRDYDRANYYYQIFMRKKDDIMRRTSPQGQKDKQPRMRDSYWPAVSERRGFTKTSDTNPGGRVD